MSASSRQASCSGSLSGPELRAMALAFRQSGRSIESTISGSSMGCALPDGCRIRILPCDPEQIQVGQIVACLHDDHLSAHRLVRFAPGGNAREYLLTQGDGWILCDPPRPISTVIGVVTEFFDGASWRVPSAWAQRNPDAAAAARTHVRITGLFLWIHPRLARAWTRWMVMVYTLRENLRRSWAEPR